MGSHNAGPQRRTVTIPSNLGLKVVKWSFIILLSTLMLCLAGTIVIATITAVSP